MDAVGVAFTLVLPVAEAFGEGVSATDGPRLAGVFGAAVWPGGNEGVPLELPGNSDEGAISVQPAKVMVVKEANVR